MTVDIRQLLQHAKGPSKELDEAIGKALGNPHPFGWSAQYRAAINIVEAKGYDWIMANVNGHVGGTPYAGVGDVKDCYADTPLLSLWLAFFRAELGDERETNEVYAAGFYDGNGCYGMFAGPTPELNDILQHSPRHVEKPAFILKMVGDVEEGTTTRIYRWHPRKREWIKLTEKNDGKA